MTNRPKVLITSPMHEDGMTVLAPHADVVVAPDTADDTYRKMAAEVDGIITRNKLPDDICDHGPNLKGIVRHGVGLDFIPVAAATAKGIAVANLPGVNAQAVAEYCIAAVQHLRRPLVHADRDHRALGWDKGRAPAPSFVEMGGATLGIVGVGSIGKHLARIARDGFGMTVLGASRRKGRMPEGIEEVDLDDLFRRANAIALCCPLTDETRGLANAARFKLMKKDAVIVNVSRGPVVDTAALIDALTSGIIAGAATDVYDVHPLANDHPLLTCPNILLTPHVAGITATSGRNMAVFSAEEMVRIIQGGDPENFVNPECRA